MFNPFRKIFPEFELLKDLREENKDEYFSWFRINLILPLFIIILPIILYIISTYLKFDWKDFKNKVFNGSIPLTAVGLLVSSLFVLVKYNVSNETRLGMQWINAFRNKLIIWIVILLLSAWGIYYVENFDMPEGAWGVGIFAFFSVGLLITVIYLAKNVFYMQDSFLYSSLNMTTPVDLTSENLKGQRLCKMQRENA